MRYRFAGLELDADRLELRRGRGRVAIEPAALRLLVELASRAERTVPAAELCRALWPNEPVTARSLERAVRAARRALEGAGASAALLGAVRGRGYRLDARVQALRAPVGRGAQAEPDPFVGRRRELGALERALTAAAAGRGRLVLVSGEPGIGKTRLAAELESRARASGARVLWGRSWDGGEAPPYWPWRQIVRAHLAETDTETLRRELGRGVGDLCRAIPELAQRLGAVGPDAALDPAQARFRLFEATARFLERATRERPWVILLDDLHAADAPSSLLLRHLGRELGAMRLLVLATYRPTEVPALPVLARALESLRRERTCDELSLGALSETDSRRLVATLSRRRIPIELAGSIVTRADGNPFFVRELVRDLSRDAPGIVAGARDAIRVPASVQQMIALRVAALSPGARETLAIGAVLGPRFSAAALAATSAGDRPALLAALSEAEAAGLLAADPERAGELRFVHALVSDAIYAGLSLAERASLHRRAGTALESLGAGMPQAPFAELARHFLAGAASGDRAAAIDYCARAAEQAAAALAFEDAARHCLHALDALAAAGLRDDARRCGLLLRLAEAQERSGDAAAAVRRRKEAIGVAREAGLVEPFAEAACALANENVLEADDPERRAALEEALVRVGATDALRARVLAALCRQLTWSGDLTTRRKLHAEAVAAARRAGDRATLLSVLSTDPALVVLEDDALRATRIGELRDLARELRDGERECAAWHLALSNRIASADPEGIEHELAGFARCVEELRHPRFRYWVAVARAARALWRGPLDQAEELARAALELAGPVDEQPATLGTFCMQLSALRRLQGRFDEALAPIREVAERNPTMGLLAVLVPIALAEAGLRDEAHDAMAPLVDRIERIAQGPAQLVSLAMLAEACAKLGDAERAARLYPLLLPHAGRYVAVYASLTYGCASRALGQLAALLGHADAALAHLHEALEVERRMYARPWIALTELDCARLCDARGEIALARRHAQAAGRLGAALAMPHVVASSASLSDARGQASHS